MSKDKALTVMTENEDVLRYEESALYEEKIRRLEDSLSSLRMSRRILMNLLEQVQTAHQAENERLLRENQRLRRRINACIQQLWRNGAEQARLREDDGSIP